MHYYCKTGVSNSFSPAGPVSGMGQDEWQGASSMGQIRLIDFPLTCWIQHMVHAPTSLGQVLHAEQILDWPEWVLDLASRDPWTCSLPPPPSCKPDPATGLSGTAFLPTQTGADGAYGMCPGQARAGAMGRMDPRLARMGALPCVAHSWTSGGRCHMWCVPQTSWSMQCVQHTS